ncbi:MAG: DUF1343 domain-containing protein [Myxococcales bacterium]|nr:DUF1343 domain-containing protein [Myxococcales bacterium]
MTRCGLDQLLDERIDTLRGRRFGLLCHAASVSSRLEHALDALLARGATPHRLFGPEHGLDGAAQDMVAVAAARRGAPRDIELISLYGSDEASLSPPPGSLDGLDLLLVDLQDVGSRYYTYVWTMVLAMQACARAGVAVWVLDRPNPLGGRAIEGPGIEPPCISFVGLHDMPVRHGLTAGEIASLCRAERTIDVELEVITMQAWRRAALFDELDLPWVMPSPNMPTLETALVYPGGCLYEGTNLSEGRGTTRPFEIVGAPYLDGRAFAERLTRFELEGVRFRALSFQPTFQKHSGTVCGGVQIHVTDRARFAPLRCGVAVMLAAAELSGGVGQAALDERFAWRAAPYEFVSDRPAIDLLAGGAWLREGIEANLALDALCAPWRDSEARFAERRRAHLLYADDHRADNDGVGR